MTTWKSVNGRGGVEEVLCDALSFAVTSWRVASLDPVPSQTAELPATCSATAVRHTGGATKAISWQWPLLLPQA